MRYGRLIRNYNNARGGRTSAAASALFHGYESQISIWAHPQTAQGTGSGSSRANATTLADVMANATGGNVGLLAGTGTGTNTSNRHTPAFRPVNGGSVGNPLRIIAEYPWSNVANRTELRSGGVSNGVDGCPAFGADGVNYVEWIGIYVDEANSFTEPDTGPVVLWGSTGSKISKCRIIGDPTNTPGDNHNGVRVEGCIGATVEDCTINNFFSGVGFASNGTGITVYGTSGLQLNHNHIYDCYRGIAVKGSTGGGTVQSGGQASYNRLHDLQFAFSAHDIDSALDMLFEHNLCYLLSQYGAVYANLARPDSVRRIKVRNNSFILTIDPASVGIWVMGGVTGVNNEFSKNIIAKYSATNGGYVDGGSYTDNNFQAIALNGFYGSTAANKFSWNGANQANVAAFEAAAANASSNSELGSDPFPNRGSGDYTVGGAAATLDSGNPIGANYSQVGPR